MDSVGAYSFGSTRRFAVGYTAGDDITESSNLGKSFSDTLYSMESEKEEEKANSSDVAQGNDPWSGFKMVRPGNIGDTPNVSQRSMVRDIGSIRQQFILYLWRLFFGEDSANDFSKRYGVDDMSAGSESFAAASTGQAPYGTIKLYGYEERYSVETQNVSFSSAGTVTTSDGQTIRFNLDFEMTERFEQVYRTRSEDVVSLCDPLVLNFSGDIAGLADQKFTFDLDCDSIPEEISVLKEGNGFLSLDSNGDGIINDGSELFGTRSGDGFADLTAYDQDRNGWIDENDDIFERLSIWYKDEAGNDKLLNLKDAGVGAIYLGNSETDFRLRSAEPTDINGVIRKTGIFLYENAMVGMMVHMDMAKVSKMA